MSLQFIMGGAGSGKSTYLYRMISREAAEHREKNYFVLVPDQFTLETQKALVEQSGNGGILNVDVLSFHRLAYRVFESVPALRKTVLEDMGKMMLLRKVFSEQRKNLKYFKKGLNKPGFLDECKSFLCELTQYAVSEEDFDRMEACLGQDSLMAYKLRDLRVIYHAFREKMGDTYMMAEELVTQLTSVAASMDMLRDSVICLDGFTGFTPTQYDLLRELMVCCDRMIVTVTTDRTERRERTFSLSGDTITRLSKIAAEVRCAVEEPVLTGKGKEKIPWRVAESPELSFLEKNIFSYGGEKWTGDTEDIEVRVCRKELDEAAYVARRIWWLVHEEKYRFDEIAVVTAGDIGVYEHALAREMDKMGIRYFMDYKRSIGANALAEYVLSFMEMFRKGMDYESAFRFLRCGLSPLSPEETDILENYVIARGRRGIASYSQEWKSDVEQLDIAQVNEYRVKFVDSVREAFSDLRGGKKTVREFTEILYRLIDRNGLYEKLLEKSSLFEEEENVLLADEYRSIYRMMMGLFDELVELLGDETVTFREYEELLASGISEGLIGFVPPSSNQVIVGDVERSRLRNIKVLFFIGVNDDRILKGSQTQGMLTENERRKIREAGIELAPSAEELVYNEQFYLYLTLAKPSRKLILTYAKMDGGGEDKRPAYLIYILRKLFPGLVCGDDEKDVSVHHILGTDRGRSYFISHLSDKSYREDMVWWELAAYYREKEPALMPGLLAMGKPGRGRTKLSEKAVELLYGERLRGSVTRLESFARCPYAHYIMYGLRLKEREEYKVNALDYGNIFHGALEHISHEMETLHKTWRDLKEEELEKLADESIEYVVRGYRGEMFDQSKRVEFTVRRMKRVMRNVVWGIWKQMLDGAFEQAYAEEKFQGGVELETLRIPLQNDRLLTLGGKIDRVDTCVDGDDRLIKIVDYKSRKQELSLVNVYYGLQLQLVTYMAAAMELEEKRYPGSSSVPAAMLYSPMRKPELKWREESKEEREARLLGEMKCGGYANAEAGILGKIDRKLASGGKLIPGGKSGVLAVEVRKDGDFRSGSKIMSTEQFGRLMRHVRAKLGEFGNRIMDGEIQAAPYLLEKECGCDYCGYNGICGMEKSELSENVRECPSVKEDEIWEVLYGSDKVDRSAEKND